MTLQETIREAMKDAMRNKDKLRLEVLRSLLAGFTNELVATGKKPDAEVTDDIALKVLKKALKQRKDASEQFKTGGREDLAEKEEKEAEIISEFLPESLSKEEIEKLVKECIAELDASSMADFSKVMPCAMRKVSGRADGSDVKSAVEDLLG